uniref:Zinc finger, CCHC-type n=1 Tax=Syphacia muris TaxID=451379 RepID=A0A0N5B1N7_9BILA
MRDLLKEEAQLIEELRFKVEVVERESSDDLRSSGTQEHYEVKGKSGLRVGKSNPSNKSYLNKLLVKGSPFKRNSQVEDGAVKFGSKEPQWLKLSLNYILLPTEEDKAKSNIDFCKFAESDSKRLQKISEGSKKKIRNL